MLAWYLHSNLAHLFQLGNVSFWRYKILLNSTRPVAFFLHGHSFKAGSFCLGYRRGFITLSPVFPPSIPTNILLAAPKSSIYTHGMLSASSNQISKPRLVCCSVQCCAAPIARKFIHHLIPRCPCLYQHTGTESAAARLDSCSSHHPKWILSAILFHCWYVVYFLLIPD
jgi:hypothetical protein